MTSEIVYFYATLLRHGETYANAENVIQGHMDTELSPTGVSQARELKEYFVNLPIDLLISSDLKRAYQTAELIGNSVPLEKDNRLRERNFGQYCGARRSELQSFAEQNAQNGGGCDGWRNVRGECSHEMAYRTSKFLTDLCTRLAQKVRNKEASTQCECDVRSPVFQGSPITLMPGPLQEFIESCDQNIYHYAGHVLMVSHGGWIRHFLRLAALQSEYSLHFPKRCINSVMRNCGICQIGIAFDPQQLEVFQSQLPSPSNLSHSPLPVFGSFLEYSDQESQCQFFQLAHQRLPIHAVCYHFDVVKHDLDSHRKDQPINSHGAGSAAENLCSTMEVIFSDDGDEYAGLSQPLE